MARYAIRFVSDGLRARYDALRARAAAAGKLAEFRYWFQDVGAALEDPARALRVGRPLGPTALPGGFLRDWVHGCFYLRYVIYPDPGVGFVYHLEFSDPNWA